MEEVHRFIKKQGIADYKEIGFKIFQLFGLDTELQDKNEELKELELEDN
jgi:hypothetical protein